MWTSISLSIFLLLFSAFKINYRVRQGDSLYLIGKKFNVTVKQIKKWNHLKNNLLKPHMKILIYKNIIYKKKFYTVRAGDSLSRIARKLKLKISDLRLWNGANVKIIVPEQKIIYYKLTKFVKSKKSRIKLKQKKKRQNKKKRKNKKKRLKRHKKKRYINGKISKNIMIWYKIRKGDSLWKIARKYKVFIKSIRRSNSKKSLRILRPGRKIRIPINNPDYIYVLRPYLKDFVRFKPSKYVHIKNPANVWGQKFFIDDITQCIEKTMQKYPHSAKMVIGDISRKTGGYFPPHLSHRTGRDIDIGYFLKGNKQLNYFKVINPSELDVEKNWDFIEECLKTKDVEFMFVDHSLQKPLYDYAKKIGFTKKELNKLFQYPASKRVKKGIIRHFKGHKHHIHIRLYCPAHNKNCR